jgi:hypothetical protein
LDKIDESHIIFESAEHTCSSVSQIDLKFFFSPGRERKHLLSAKIKAIVTIHALFLITDYLLSKHRQGVKGTGLDTLSTACALREVNDTAIYPMLSSLRFLGNTTHTHILDGAAKARQFMPLHVRKNHHGVGTQNFFGYFYPVQRAARNPPGNVHPLAIIPLLPIGDYYRRS